MSSPVHCRLMNRLAALLVAGVSFAANADAPKYEQAFPVPEYAPRASAALVVCSPVAGSYLAGKESAKNKRPEVAATFTGESTDRADKQFMRVHFLGSGLKMALGSYLENKLTWGPDFDYTVESDAPEDFVAIKAGSGQMGMLQTLVLNRVTGAAILTLTLGSYKPGTLPSTSSTFYVCAP